jgi:translation initiation factor 1
MSRNRTKNTVYSTDKGRHCDNCNRPKTDCACGTLGATSSKDSMGDGIVRIQRQSKGRAGKPVCIITGLNLETAELKKIAKQLKAKCGVGGTIEQGNIVIQGDNRDTIKSELESRGFTVKLAGG